MVVSANQPQIERGCQEFFFGGGRGVAKIFEAAGWNFKDFAVGQFCLNKFWAFLIMERMKTFKRFFAFVLLCAAVCAPLFAGSVKVVPVKSEAMNKDIKTLVVLPDACANADANKKFPVVYLLHGFGGNYKSWLDIKPNLPDLADRYGIIFVLTDGATSWYWDSPVNPKLKYETFVSKELVDFIDANFKTRAEAAGRAVSGLSMGGHGALWLAINHPDVFGAAGSTSGGVDIRPFPKNWDMAKNLGEYKDNPQVWDAHTVTENLDKIGKDTPAFIIDCGFDDFFFKVNEALHEKMLSRKIAHDYLTRPGAHNGKYWNNSIDYHIVFFDKFFNRK